jgi:hypothetical protein
MRKFFATILTAFLMLSPAIAAEIDPPIKFDITGVVVSHTDKIKSSAIVDDRIWWEGETIRVRNEDDEWLTLTLIKVEMVEGKGGVCTFQVEEDVEDKSTFTATIRKSTRYGLTR